MPENVTILESHGASPDDVAIEIIFARLKLPSWQTIHLTLVYRSPSVSITDLINTLASILLELESCDVISYILGDFNVDLTKSDSNLEALMAGCGYSQLVHTPTTDQGTLIDHVYCNIPQPELVETHVTDIYYSDHDAVLCSIPISLQTE